MREPVVESHKFEGLDFSEDDVVAALVRYARSKGEMTPDAEHLRVVKMGSTRRRDTGCILSLFSR